MDGCGRSGRRGEPSRVLFCHSVVVAASSRHCYGCIGVDILAIFVGFSGNGKVGSAAGGRRLIEHSSKIGAKSFADPVGKAVCRRKASKVRTRLRREVVAK